MSKPKDEQAHERTDFGMNTPRCQWLCVVFVELHT